MSTNPPYLTLGAYGEYTLGAYGEYVDARMMLQGHDSSLDRIKYLREGNFVSSDVPIDKADPNVVANPGEVFLIGQQENSVTVFVSSGFNFPEQPVFEVTEKLIATRVDDGFLFRPLETSNLFNMFFGDTWHLQCYSDYKPIFNGLINKLEEEAGTAVLIELDVDYIPIYAEWFETFRSNGIRFRSFKFTEVESGEQVVQ